MNTAFPFHIDVGGRTAAEPHRDAYIRSLIEQVLFTSPGERVNRPDFGSGLLQMVFAPNNEALAATTQLTTQAALQEWLGDLIEVEQVEAVGIDARLEVTVHYVIRRTRERQAATFRREGSP